MDQADQELRQHLTAVKATARGRVTGAELVVGRVLSAVLVARSACGLDDDVARLATHSLKLRKSVTRLRLELERAEAAAADAETDAQAILAADLLAIVGQGGVAAAAAAGRLQRQLPGQADPRDTDTTGPPPVGEVSGASLLEEMDRALADLEAVIAEHRVDSENEPTR